MQTKAFKLALPRYTPETQELRDLIEPALIERLALYKEKKQIALHIKCVSGICKAFARFSGKFTGTGCRRRLVGGCGTESIHAHKISIAVAIRLRPGLTSSCGIR